MTAERHEPLILADGRVCTCGCKSCCGEYAHCLKHEKNCHLLDFCGFQPGMLCCPMADPDPLAAAARAVREREAEAAAAEQERYAARMRLMSEEAA